MGFFLKKNFRVFYYYWHLRYFLRVPTQSLGPLQLSFTCVAQSVKQTSQLVKHDVLKHVLSFQLSASSVLEAEAEAVEAALFQSNWKRKRKRSSKTEWKRKRKRFSIQILNWKRKRKRFCLFLMKMEAEAVFSSTWKRQRKRQKMWKRFGLIIEKLKQ